MFAFDIKIMLFSLYVRFPEEEKNKKVQIIHLFAIKHGVSLK